ncbi:uncharacterized protein [Littorina saxatilis]|uniref:uncharacterized protein n=1 Tax=Littorina saxatilis TaxID=31220 RepID=UPI0038B621D8
MAGIAESCSHIAAVLFTVYASVRIRDSQTPTQVPAGWVVPPTKDVVYRKAADIDFTSAATKKRRLDGFINGTPTLTKAKRKQTNVAAPTKDELNSFFEAFQFSKTGVKPAVLSLVPEYATDYKNQQATVRLPKFLGDLEDEEQVQRTYSEVLQHCENVDISVTEEQCIIAERETRAQRNSKTRARLRTGRITASRAHQALHTNPAKPSMSLISLVCRPKGPRKETASMQWGIEKEHIALSEYEEMASKQHKHFQMDKCGLFIHAQFPFLGTSPDGVRYCSCCGRGCVEVKCPASKASCTLSECLEDPKFYLEKRDRVLSLKEKHEYYTQVQLQMSVTKTEFCDFVVWTPKDLAVVKVEYDPEFMQDALEKLAHVYQVAILPELVGKVFSRARPQPPTATNTQSACPLPLSPTKGSAAQLTCSGSPVKLFCYCKRGEEEDAMVACDNENCKLEWFHFFCVGIKSAPKGQWYCPDCRQLPEFRRTGKSKPKVLSQQRL